VIAALVRPRVARVAFSTPARRELIAKGWSLPRSSGPAKHAGRSAHPRGGELITKGWSLPRSSGPAKHAGRSAHPRGGELIANGLVIAALVRPREARVAFAGSARHAAQALPAHPARRSTPG